MAATPAQPWRSEARSAGVLQLRLRVHAQPGARRSEVAGVHGDAIRIRIAAPAVEGRANDELVRYLAELFHVPQRAVTIVGGASSRRKDVRIVAPAQRPDDGWR